MVVDCLPPSLIFDQLCAVFAQVIFFFLVCFFLYVFSCFFLSVKYAYFLHIRGTFYFVPTKHVKNKIEDSGAGCLARYLKFMLAA